MDFSAVIKGDRNQVKKLIEKGEYNVNDCHNGETLLHIACRHGQLEMVKMLIELGADINKKSSDGSTPLHKACLREQEQDVYSRDFREQLEIVKILIKSGADLNQTDDMGNKPLTYAINNGSWEIAKALTLKLGTTVLHTICNTNVKIVKNYLHYCFQRRIKVYIEKDSNGDTPLHIACRNCKMDIVNALLQQTSDSSDNTYYADEPPLLTALGCFGGFSNFSQHSSGIFSDFDGEFSSLKNNDGDTPLHIAYRSDRFDILMAILQHDADQVAGYGKAPLHLACKYGNAGIVRAVIDHSGPDNSKDESDRTPLYIACDRNRPDIVKALLQNSHHSVQVHCRTNGDAPLHVACTWGESGIVKVLLQYGSSAQVDNKNYDGDTPLHIACKKNKINVINALLQHGPIAQVNNRNTDGYTPLHTTCKLNSIDAINALLQHNPSTQVNNKTNNGSTPLHIACEWDSKDIVKILLQHGPNADIKNNDEKKPFHIACKRADQDLLVAYFKHDSTSKKNDIALVLSDWKNSCFVLLHNYILGNEMMNKKDFIAIVMTVDRCDVMKSLITKYNIQDSLGVSLLHLAAANCTRKMIEMLVKECGMPVYIVDNEGNTPLHVATREGHYDGVKCLLDLKSSLHVRNKEGETPFDLIPNQSIQSLYDYYVKNYTETIEEEYADMIKFATSKYAAAQYITKLLVVGYPGGGKSSLVETLKREGFFESTFTRVSAKSVPLHTAGIVPSIYTSDTYGRVQFYDFAGDPEYYSSHAAILERLFLSDIGTNVFIIVLNLTLSESKIKEEYIYWWHFINHNKRTLQHLPSILVIGSHADQLPSKKVEKQKKEIIRNLFQQYSAFSYFSLNCCNPGSKGIKKLRQELQKIAVRSQPYELSYEGSVLLGLLEKDFSSVTACTTKTLLTHLQDLNLLRLPRSMSGLFPFLQELQAIGTLLILSSNEDDCYLVLNIAELTNEVHKKLFSENADSSLASFKIGLLPPSLLQNKVLPKYITKDCLIQLQYCQEIPHADLIFDHDSESSISNKDFLFFPALCKLDKKDISWHYNESDYSIGWVARCTSQDYFPSRFLHVLLLRIVFSSILCVPLNVQQDNVSDQHGYLKRRCKMWKTGVHWLTEEGVECEIGVDISKEVVVSVRCKEDNLKRCFALFNSIIGCVMEAKCEFCHTNQLSFHLTDSQKNEYLLKEVERCLHEGNHSVVDITGESSMPLSNLQHIGTTFWNTLFSIDVNSVTKHLQSLVGEWFELGTHLKFPHSTLKAIEIDNRSRVVKQKEVMVEQWLDPLHSPSTDPPCWWSLVRALEDMDENACAEAIKQEHGEAINIQMKLLQSDCHSLKPDIEFLESLSSVVGSKWPRLAVFLALSSADIRAVRNEGKGMSVKKQALLMLHKWASCKEATYGQLFQKLKPISLFTLCQ